METRAAYPVDEARKLLGGLSRQHIHNMTQRGELRVVRFGRRIMIPASEIESLLEEPGTGKPAQ